MSAFFEDIEYGLDLFSALPKAALNDPQEACMSSWKSPKGNA